MLYEILKRININFEKEKYILNFRCLESKKLIIECNDDFLYCNLNKYSPDYIHSIIKINSQQKLNEDNRKLELEKLKYKVLKFLNSDIDRYLDVVL